MTVDGYYKHKLILKAEPDQETNQLVVTRVAELDPEHFARIIGLYIMPAEKYGITINADGIIEYFEYKEEKESWTDRIGHSDIYPKDDMTYKRSSEFYHDP